MADPRDSHNAVKVAVRVRPLARDEVASLVTDESDQSIRMLDPLTGRPDERTKVKFDFAFGDDEETGSQECVFECIGKPLIESAFGGYNATVLAYGQTGSGKSYTMTGHSQYDTTSGLEPRLVDALFAQADALAVRAPAPPAPVPALTLAEGTDAEQLLAASLAARPRVRFEASKLEVYNEKVYDLLQCGSRVPLKVREGVGGVFVDGLTRVLCRDAATAQLFFRQGEQNRTTAATLMNSQSSRSHAVTEVRLTQAAEDLETGEETIKTSKLSLVDLAGSERANRTGTAGERFEEGKILESKAPPRLP